MITLKKGDTKIKFTKKQTGVVIQIVDDNIKTKTTFCIVKPANLFIQKNGKWEPLNLEEKLENKREFRDPVDEISYDFSHMIYLYSKVDFLNYEYFFIEAIIYDLFNDKDINFWIPGHGKANIIELLKYEVIVYCQDGTSETYDLRDFKDVSIQAFADLKIKEDVLPPIVLKKSNILPPIVLKKSNILPPIVLKKSNIPPIVLKKSVVPLPPIKKVRVPLLEEKEIKNEYKLIKSSSSPIMIPINDIEIKTPKTPRAPVLPLIGSPRQTRKDEEEVEEVKEEEEEKEKEKEKEEEEVEEEAASVTEEAASVTEEAASVTEDEKDEKDVVKTVEIVEDVKKDERDIFDVTTEED